MTENSNLVVAGIRSYELSALALSHSEAKGMTQLLSVYIAHRYNSRRGYAHPSQVTIAEHLKRSERSIRSLVADLHEVGEWFIVTGRGGAASTGTAWASSRYYPTFEWIQRVVNELYTSGNNDTMANRIVNSSRVLEVLPNGITQPTDIQITLPHVNGEEVVNVSEQYDSAFLEDIDSVITPSERESFLNSLASDRQQARQDAQELTEDGYSLTRTISRAKENARVRPTQYDGGYARWLWSFAYRMPVKVDGAGTIWESSGESEDTTWGREG